MGLALNFHEKILRIENLSFFFESAILNLKKKFASSQLKSVNIYRIAKLGRNFDDYPCPTKKKHLPKDMQHSVAPLIITFFLT